MSLLAALLLASPSCLPSLDVGVLPVKGCYLFAKYGEPDCWPLPTWEVVPDRTIHYWTFPLYQIPGPNASVVSLPEPGSVEVTVTGSTGASRTRTIEVNDTGSTCWVVEPPPRSE